MMTAQDIRDKKFEKSRGSGYDMEMVDNFLEEMADEFSMIQSTQQKETAILKSKMKVLVDKIGEYRANEDTLNTKIEEYRANEETLNMAILSAQKLAVQIETEARQRASAIIAEAEEKAQAVLGGIDSERANIEKRLADAKDAKARFIAEARALCQAQMDKLALLDTDPAPKAVPFQMPVAEPAADPVEDTVQSIGGLPFEDTISDFELDFSELSEPAAPGKMENTQTFKV